MAKHELGDADMPDANRQKRDESSLIRIRSVITNREAGILIGEAGNTIESIRGKTQAEIDVSEPLRGAIERIFTVFGAVQDVVKTFNFAIYTLLGASDDVDVEELADYTLRLAMPHAYLGAIIGSNGYRLRQIVDASSAKIYASEFCLPLSSERVLTIVGRPDRIASALSEITQEVLKSNAKARSTTNNTYTPVSMFGRYGHPETFRLTKPHDTMLTPSNPYGIPPARFAAPAPDQLNPAGENIVMPSDPRATGARGSTKDKLTQQIYIPNDMVGAIIGKQGSKINEIRQLSGSHIKINEPEASRTNERLITVEGTQEQNQLALYMLYQRLESEKRRA